MKTTSRRITFVDGNKSPLYCSVLFRYLEPDLKSLLEEELSSSRIGSKFEKLNHSIAGMVRYFSAGMCISFLHTCRSIPVKYLINLRVVETDQQLTVL